MELIISNLKNDESKQYIIVNSHDNSLINNSKARRIIHEMCEKDGLYTKTVTNDQNMLFIIISKVKIDYGSIGFTTRKCPTEKDLSHFIRDFKLPIPVNKEPYFSYFMDMYDKLFSIREKYDLLIDAINHHEIGGSSVHKHGLIIADKIKEAVTKLPEFEKLVSNKQFTVKEFPSKKEIYEQKYSDRKAFISLDIITANFNAFKFVDPLLVLGCASWEDLIRKFTEIEYFVKSKHFRQIVFGRMGSIMKKISSIQKYLTNELYHQIKTKLDVCSVSNDEIVINSSLETFLDDVAVCNTSVQNLPENMKSIWKIIPFSLLSLGNSQAIVKSNLLTDNVEIRHIGKEYYAQAFKYYIGKEIVPYDLKFTNYDGILATFDEQIKF